MQDRDNRRYAAACDRNKEPILDRLRETLGNCRAVLEIGSGTGQHAVHFAANLPHLIWHSSDRKINHLGIQQWLDEAALANTPSPLLLDVTQAEWPQLEIDAVFSANTLHIMSWREVENLFHGVNRILPPGGLLLLYGPFNYNNQYTCESNRAFDQRLREHDPESGIRDFGALNQLAQSEQLIFRDDFQMPSNNRLLLWQKPPA